MATACAEGWSSLTVMIVPFQYTVSAVAAFADGAWDTGGDLLLSVQPMVSSNVHSVKRISFISCPYFYRVNVYRVNVLNRLAPIFCLMTVLVLMVGLVDFKPLMSELIFQLLSAHFSRFIISCYHSHGDLEREGEACAVFNEPLFLRKH